MRTHVDDDAAGSGEVHALHELVAFGAAKIADLFSFSFRQRNADGRPKDGALLFPIGADLFEGEFIGPDALACAAFVEHYFANIDAGEARVGFAARAIEHSGFANFAVRA